MKHRENIIEQLKTLPHFNKTTITQLAEQYQLKDRTVDAYISRSLKYKDLLSLKKGVYVTKDFYEKHKSDISYTFYVANILRKPSYISSWTALQYYNLTTEAIHGTISVTPKRTREHVTKLGNFSYKSIKEELFSDFYLGKGDFTFFIHTKIPHGVSLGM